MNERKNSVKNRKIDKKVVVSSLSLPLSFPFMTSVLLTQVLLLRDLRMKMRERDTRTTGPTNIITKDREKERERRKKKRERDYYFFLSANLFSF